MKWIDKVLDEKSDVAIAFFWQLVGPLFILCTFALAPTNLLIFFAGIMGLFLSAKYRMGGFIASLILLSAIAIGEHLFYSSSHLWLFGLEGSYAMAFFITAQSANQHLSFVRSLFSQLETRSSSILNLEDEFTKSRLESTKQQLFAQEKIDSLQKQLEEVLSEQSSLLVLNEVLRKTTAQHMAGKEGLSEELYHLQSRLDSELSEKEEFQAEISRLKNEHGLAAENQRLIEEIQAIRADREQTHTLKETLERLYAHEHQRAGAACAQMVSFEAEKRESDEKIAALESELKPLRVSLEQIQQDRDLYRMSAEKSDAIQRERNLLKDRLQQAEFELAQKAGSVAAPELELLEEKIKKLTSVELLYKQLRAQFEEKNVILHKTRSELFVVDNALQTLQIEMTRKELDGIPQEFVKELSSLENELSLLQEENGNLQNIISALSVPSDPIVKKKSE